MEQHENWGIMWEFKRDFLSSKVIKKGILQSAFRVWLAFGINSVHGPKVLIVINFDTE